VILIRSEISWNPTKVGFWDQKVCLLAFLQHSETKDTTFADTSWKVNIGRTVARDNLLDLQLVLCVHLPAGLVAMLIDADSTDKLSSLIMTKSHLVKKKWKLSKVYTDLSSSIIMTKEILLMI
jgi:hypothetical protein